MLQWPGVDGVGLDACTFVADALGDSVLAVGGSDGKVRVMSTMRKAEIAVIDAHKCMHVCLFRNKGMPCPLPMSVALRGV